MNLCMLKIALSNSYHNGLIVKFIFRFSIVDKNVNRLCFHHSFKMFNLLPEYGLIKMLFLFLVDWFCSEEAI